MGGSQGQRASKSEPTKGIPGEESRAVRMDKKKALRMGFIPYQPDLFANTPATTEWTRELKRPRCLEYWNPAKPGRIRRVHHVAVSESLSATHPIEQKCLAGQHGASASKQTQ